MKRILWLLALLATPAIAQDVAEIQMAAQACRLHLIKPQAVFAPGWEHCPAIMKKAFELVEGAQAAREERERQATKALADKLKSK